MPEPRRIVTAPLPLGGPLTRSQLAIHVTADALARRARAEGRRAEWRPPVLASGTDAQLAVDRELARQGLDRAVVGVDEFVARLQAHEAQAVDAAATLLAAAGVDVDLHEGSTGAELIGRAARTAFVRLYDAGLVEEADRVVEVCPRCGVVVDPTDAEEAEVDGAAVRLRLAEDLVVDVVATELIGGAVAVAVPEGHPAAGTDVALPLVATTVPVVADTDVVEPVLVVPAHDPVALATARRLGLPAPVIVDDEAVVRVAPLDGLSRYAARTAATELLEAEGVVETIEPVAESVDRCRRCATVLLPRLGRHWFLSTSDLEVAATDAVRDGVPFTPDAARQQFLDAAGSVGWWCVSRRGWHGHRAPVSRCVDCGGIAVAVDEPESCGKCMGTLVAGDEVLDPRFVAVVWPIAQAGWPDDETAAVEAGSVTLLLVGSPGVRRWALPMAAVGLRLTGALPFASVAVCEADDPDAPADTDGDPAAVRLSALLGGVDAVTAADVVAMLRSPAAGDGEIDEIASVYDQAFGAGAPGAAVTALAALARDGVRAVDRAKALAAPLLGE